MCNAIKFNGGGHLNHEIFWESMCPIKNGGGVLPEEQNDLAQMITAEWGSVAEFQTFFNTHTATLQGSGWGWLLYNKNSRMLEYRQTNNQDTPYDLGAGMRPILGIDVWEHAYYLDYKNLRPMYLKEIWKVINWEKASERLAEAKAEE